MANYSKSFNFRNGVQVDDDNFIVNQTGLVGIGTSVPTQLLDVNGNINVIGLLNAGNLNLIGISTLAETRVGFGITLDPSTGIITAVKYFGDGSTLSNLPTSQWIDTDVGLGFTSIYAYGYVGVGTFDPRYIFQVGGQPGVGDQKGVGINSTGGVVVSGVVTSYSGFSGPGLGITQLNADYLVVGSITTDRIPVIPNALIPNFLSVGIVTASNGFRGNLIGDVSGNTNGNFVQAGIITATNIFQGNISGVAATVTYLNVGILTASTNIFGSVTGQFFGNIIGSLTGVADSAKALTGGPNIFVNNAFTTSIVNQTNLITGFTSITSGLQIGTRGLDFTVTTSGAVGIGTSQPNSANLQIRKSSPLVEVIGDGGTALISIGQSVGVGNSVGLLRFGSVQGQFDLSNRSPGNFNFILHEGDNSGISTSLGITTGGFSWRYGQTNSQIMYLDYTGKLNLGSYASPVETLSIVGSSTVTSDSYVGGNLSVIGFLTILGNGGEKIVLGAGVSNTFQKTNIYTTTGISTFNTLNILSQLNLLSGSRIGIGSTTPQVELDGGSVTATFGNLGIGTTGSFGSINPDTNFIVQGKSVFSGGVGIGTTIAPNSQLYVGSPPNTSGEIEIDRQNIKLTRTVILSDGFSSIGIGTTFNYGAVDFSNAGVGYTTVAGRYVNFMLPPFVTTTIRSGLATVAGAIIYNTTTNKHQGWNGSAWFDFY